MILYKSAVTIARPPDAIFRYLVEPELQATWSDTPMRPADPGPIGPGSRVQVTFTAGSVNAELGLAIVAVEPVRRLTWRTLDGPILWEVEYLLVPSGESTELRHDGRLTFTGRRRLMEPLVGGGIRQRQIQELEKLKAVVEAS